MDSEQFNMLATCDRLSARLSGQERAALGRLNRLDTSARMPDADDAELRALWDKVTVNGTVDT